MQTSRTLLALAVLAGATIGCDRAPGPRHEATAPPNVLLVTIDTFRADRLTSSVAPAIDRLARAGLRFTAARSAVPLTLPSHATILTGLLPPSHGVRENGVDVLSDSHPTVARLLQARGYRTAAFVGAFVLDRRFGLAQGFDTYDDRIPRNPEATERLEAERPAGAVVDAALGWLANPPAPPALPAPPGPFFLWIHLYDPHAPYNPPPEFLHAASRYDGEISYADSQIARVFEALRQRALFDRTLVIVAGDHGEGLGDHGEQTHGMLLYESTLRVPLIVAAPGHAAGERADAVSLADVAPTILHAAGVTPPSEMKGRVLLDVRPRSVTRRGKADTTSGGEKYDLYAETEYPRVAGWSALQSLTDGRWKVIRAGAAAEVYDLQHDADERRNLAGEQPSIAAAMLGRIDALRSAESARQPRALSRQAEEQLRALGYVASSAQVTSSDRASNPAASIADWNAFEDALALLNEGKPTAVNALGALASAHPDAPVFQSTYARALKDAGRLREALEVYRRSAQRWPTDATLLHDFAVAARDAANRATNADGNALRDEALRADRAALTVSPSSAVARNGLGLLAVDQNRPADAAREFEQAAALDPNNASYWANLGNAKRAVGDRVGAEQAYRKALDVDPRFADAANGLGVLLIEAERPADAVPWLERALAAAPDFVEARLNLGIALQQAGQRARAADTYRAVLAARGDHPREKDAARHLLGALGR